MQKKESIKLFTIEENVKCVKCGSKGAIQFYGEWYKNGLGEEAKNIIALKEYENKPFMSNSVGFGGTIPYECLNCGNIGLIDTGGLEGYDLAFVTIKKE